MKSALLIIDMQNDFVKLNGTAVINNADKIVASIKSLLKYYRASKQLIVHVIRQYRKDGADVEKFRLEKFLIKPFAVPGTWESEIISELKPEDNEIVLVKNRFSAFMGTELDFILRRNNIKTITLCGVQYPNCIRATAFDAVSLDYDVEILYECCAAVNQEIENANIIDLKNINVKFFTFNEYINNKIFAQQGDAPEPASGD